MLGHIRTGTLDKFKEGFNNALNEGKNFSTAAADCTKLFMSQFDEASAGTVIDIQYSFQTRGLCNDKIMQLTSEMNSLKEVLKESINYEV